ncbi:hypothetical protein C8J57DRAFT_1726928 [Mycena rebaudengoi]|nr:hypothetical protein C8J57DRAFT_1726928 [Mycena rebaudengoi]
MSHHRCVFAYIPAVVYTEPGRFLANPDSTLGVESGSKLITLPPDGTVVKLQCWDKADTESFRSIPRSREQEGGADGGRAAPRFAEGEVLLFAEASEILDKVHKGAFDDDMSPGVKPSTPGAVPAAQAEKALRTPVIASSAISVSPAPRIFSTSTSSTPTHEPSRPECLHQHRHLQHNDQHPHHHRASSPMHPTRLLPTPPLRPNTRHAPALTRRRTNPPEAPAAWSTTCIRRRVSTVARIYPHSYLGRASVLAPRP